MRAGPRPCPSRCASLTATVPVWSAEILTGDGS